MRCPYCNKVVGDYRIHVNRVHGIRTENPIEVRDNQVYADYIRDRRTRYLRRQAAK